MSSAQQTTMAALGVELAAAASADAILPADWSFDDTLTALYGRPTYRRLDGFAVMDGAPEGRPQRDEWRVLDARGVTPPELGYRCTTAREAMDLLDQALPLSPRMGGA